MSDDTNISKVFTVGIITLGVIICCNIGFTKFAEIKALEIEKQHVLEVTKQKSIEQDKARKRKIWERPNRGCTDSRPSLILLLLKPNSVDTEIEPKAFSKL